MYSILIRAEGKNWQYHLDEDEAVWEGTLAEAKAEVVKLLATVTTNNIKVVHNTVIDFTGVAITDVTA